MDDNFCYKITAAIIDRIKVIYLNSHYSNEIKAIDMIACVVII